jgi:hypothetical protein
VSAATTGFVIGIGVALGDIVVGLVRDVRDQVVVPVVGAVAGGVDVFVVGPVGRAMEQARGGGYPRAGRRSGFRRAGSREARDARSRADTIPSPSANAIGDDPGTSPHSDVDSPDS